MQINIVMVLFDSSLGMGLDVSFMPIQLFYTSVIILRFMLLMSPIFIHCLSKSCKLFIKTYGLEIFLRLIILMAESLLLISIENMCHKT